MEKHKTPTSAAEDSNAPRIIILHDAAAVHTQWIFHNAVKLKLPSHYTQRFCHAVRTHVSPLVLSALASRFKLSAVAWLSISPVPSWPAVSQKRFEDDATLQLCCLFPGVWG
jgi:hypothetical protein